MIATFPRREAEAETVAVEIEAVPTVQELVAMSTPERVLAKVVEWTEKGKPSKWTITDAGHALLGEIMRRNGRLLAEAESKRPAVITQPPLTPSQQAAAWAAEAFADDTP